MRKWKCCCKRRIARQHGGDSAGVCGEGSDVAAGGESRQSRQRLQRAQRDVEGARRNGGVQRRGFIFADRRDAEVAGGAGGGSGHCHRFALAAGGIADTAAVAAPATFWKRSSICYCGLFWGCGSKTRSAVSKLLPGVPHRRFCRYSASSAGASIRRFFSWRASSVSAWRKLPVLWGHSGGTRIHPLAGRGAHVSGDVAHPRGMTSRASMMVGRTVTAPAG